MRSSGSGAGTTVAALPETLAEVDGLLAGLTASARDRVDALGHSELGPVLVALRQVQARCDSLILATIGEVDARGTFTLDGALTTGAWVRATIHPTPGVAQRLARTARALRTQNLPNTVAALAAGAFGASHAGIITDGVRDAPAEAVALIEADVVDLATETDERGTANLMRAFQHALDPDAADKAAIRRHERAGITLSPLLDGGFYLRGTADEITGALILDAINQASPPVKGDTRTAARRRLDGLSDICRQILDNPEIATAGPTGRRRTHLIVTIDPSVFTPKTDQATDRDDTDADEVSDTDTDTDLSADLDADQDDTGTDEVSDTAAATRTRTETSTGTETSTSTTAEGARGTVAGNGCPGATLSWAGWIAASTARRAGCDAQTTFVTLNADGEVVEAGTQRWYFTPAQRRAIIGRDGDRCPAPWCDRPITWSDAHHLRHREHGGPTTITNGALPCEGHHLMLHEGHWQLHRQRDGRYTLHNPSTKVTLGPEPHPPGHNRPSGHLRT